MQATFKLKNPRKGTETFTHEPVPISQEAFKLKNPRKGTETSILIFFEKNLSPFKLKNPRKGTETRYCNNQIILDTVFQIKESPEGDWNIKMTRQKKRREKTFKLKNPRKGTETSTLTREQFDRLKLSN